MSWWYTPDAQWIFSKFFSAGLSLFAFWLFFRENGRLFHGEHSQILKLISSRDDFERDRQVSSPFLNYKL